jgi:PKD repeat protein
MSLFYPRQALSGIVGLLMVGLALPLPAQPANSSPRLLSRNARAQEVLESLRNRLPEVARLNGLEPHALEALVRRDRDLWFDREARIFYVCEGLDHPHSAEATTASGEVSSASAVPNSTDSFKLHSLPGSTRVVYLDFDGHVTSGTAWNTSKTGGADIISAPFDMDGNPTSWSATELDRIKRIWQRVAEDFAPFAVDVTTEDPGVEALRRSSSTDTAYGIRVVVSPSSSWYGSAGGVAYLGSFQSSTDLPCFVFSDRLGPNNEKYVAEAISHEVGHTLGLNHDGKTDGTGYYQGHGDWAPIMGVGYYRAVTQWSKGEYALANNLEDDLAKIPTYGAPLAVDDYGNTLATAASLGGSSVLAYGVIENRADVDVFSFNTGSGTVSFTLSGTAPQTNLDIKAELLNASGAVIQTSDGTGLGASISASVPGGTYYLRIQGVGTGDPATTGYSDYASVGEYRISGTTVALTASQPPVAQVAATPTSGVGPLSVTFSSSGSSDSDGSISGYSWTFGDGASSTAANPVHVYQDAGSYTAVLTVIDNSGLASSASVVITVTSPANQLPVAKAAASVTSGPAPLAVTFSSAGSTDPDGAITGYHWNFGDGTSSTAANPGKTFSAAGTYTVILTVTDDRGGTGSASLSITATDVNRDIDVSAYTLSLDSAPSGTAAIATIKVLDRLGRAVPGATVSIEWAGLVTGTASGTTNSSGVVTFTSRRAKRSGTITGSIRSVTAPSGYRYESSLYTEPLSKSISVTR